MCTQYSAFGLWVPVSSVLTHSRLDVLCYDPAPRKDPKPVFLLSPSSSCFSPSPLPYILPPSLPPSLALSHQLLLRTFFRPVFWCLHTTTAAESTKLCTIRTSDTVVHSSNNLSCSSHFLLSRHTSAGSRSPSLLVPSFLPSRSSLASPFPCLRRPQRRCRISLPSLPPLLVLLLLPPLPATESNPIPYQSTEPGVQASSIIHHTTPTHDTKLTVT